MKEIFIRATFGAIYVIVLLSAIFISKYTFFGVILLLGLISLQEFLKLIHLKSIVLFGILILFLYYFSYLQFDFYATKLLLLLTGFVNLFLFKDLLWTSMIPMFEKKKYVVSLFYLISGFVFLAMIPLDKSIIPLDKYDDYDPFLIASIFVLVWANDIFAFLIGKRFGKRKLFERISPNKTVAGFFGGMAACIISGLLISYFLNTHNFFFWLGLAILISFIGPIGDLIQSKFKRQAGVKDSGTLIPGHGGAYDRLDSLIYSSPFIYTYITLANYVS